MSREVVLQLPDMGGGEGRSASYCLSMIPLKGLKWNYKLPMEKPSSKVLRLRVSTTLVFEFECSALEAFCGVETCPGSCYCPTYDLDFHIRIYCVFIQIQVP